MAKLLDENSLLAVRQYVREGLATKMDTKTIDATPTSGHTNNLVSSAGVYDAIASAISGVYRFQGTQTVAWLNENFSGQSVTSAMNGNVYNVSTAGTLTGGTVNVPVVAGDNVAIVWVSANNWYWDKLSAAIDVSNFVTKNAAISPVTSNTLLKIKYDAQGLITGSTAVTASDIPSLSSTYVTLTSDQNVTGFKTFINADGIAIKNNASTSYLAKIIARDDGFLTFVRRDVPNDGDFTYLTFLSGRADFRLNVCPAPYSAFSQYYDLGSTTAQWGNLYLHGNLSDGTNEITVAQMKTAYDAISGGGSVSGLVYTSGDPQTITSIKTFTDQIKFNNSDNTANSFTLKAEKAGNTSVFTIGGTLTNIKFYDESNQRILVNGILQPASVQGDYNLGTSVNRWNNIYLKGNLSDGTNSVSVSSINNAVALANKGIATQQEAYNILTTGVIS